MPSDRPDLLLAVATRLATDSALRAHLRASARAAVEPQSWETVIAHFESDLAHVIARSRSTALEPAVV